MASQPWKRFNSNNNGVNDAGADYDDDDTAHEGVINNSKHNSFSKKTLMGTMSWTLQWSKRQNLAMQVSS